MKTIVGSLMYLANNVSIHKYDLDFLVAQYLDVFEKGIRGFCKYVLYIYAREQTARHAASIFRF